MFNVTPFNVVDDGLGIHVCNDHPSHCTIPTFRKYCVSEDGKVMYSHLKEIYPLPRHPRDKTKENTYYQNILISDNGSAKNVARHRAVLAAHRGFAVDPAKVYVNHIDFIPGNDHVDNLEWCTHEENMKYSWGAGRMVNLYQSIDVLDVETGIVITYKTIAEFIRIVNVHPRTIYSRLNTDNAIIYNAKYRYKRSEEEWSTTDPATFIYQYSYLGKEIHVLDLRTHKVLKYRTVAKAASSLNIRPSLISNNCLKKLTTPCNGYIFRYNTDDIEWPVFNHLQLELLKQLNYPQSMSSGCAFYDDNGNCVFIGTYFEMAKQFDLSLKTLQNYVYKGDMVRGYRTVHIRKTGSCEVYDAGEDI